MNPTQWVSKCGKVTLYHGDCMDVLKAMPENSVDSIATDPPYGLSFMGKAWDCDVPRKEIWAECLRVLKPGGHLLSFAGTWSRHSVAAIGSSGKSFAAKKYAANPS